VKNLVLIGFMGSGKSTVGHIAAHELGLQFVDVDREIEEREGMSISDIFSKLGEEKFRDLESEMIRELSLRKDQVLATGGGAILRPINIENLKNTSVLVLLHVDAATAHMRTKDHHHRPLLNCTDSQQLIQDLLESRRALYDSIPNTVETVGRTPHEVARAVIRIYRSHS
jgi:shikimate kinase